VKLLIVEDDELLANSIAEYVKEMFDEVYLTKRIQDAKTMLIAHSPEIILLDNRLPDGDGLSVLGLFKEINPVSEIIIMTAYGDNKTIVESIKKGAFHYISKPFEIDEVINLLNKAREHVKTKIERFNLDINNIELIGTSVYLRNIKEIIERIKDFDVPVLITGETGTGKEVVAKRIHYTSIRKHKPFVAVNCSTIPSELFESELFGYEKGAFTGAVSKRKGLFEEVEDGTLFLDEIGDMPLHMQTKILRVIEERRYRRIGGNGEIPFRGRVIAATNKNLREEIDKGSFREDLFFRLNVINIEIPPLRERKEDIVALVDYFVQIYSKRYHKNISKIEKCFYNRILAYDWPGNVRELKNVIERAVILSRGKKLDCESIYFENSRTKLYSPLMSLEDVEKVHIKNVLEHVNWNKSKAAKILGISRITLRNKIKKYELEG